MPGAFVRGADERGRTARGRASHSLVHTASVVQVRDGRTETSPGPAVKTDPQLIAYYKVEANDPDQAADMAARIPGARFGSVEVRQVVDFG
jgi:hypothetical protein